MRLICSVSGCPKPAKPDWFRGKKVSQDIKSRLKKSMAGFRCFQSIQGTTIEESNLTFIPRRRPKTPENTTSSLEETTLEELLDTNNATIEIKTTIISPTEVILEEVLIARAILYKSHVTLKDAGFFTCRNSCASPLNLTLHVLTGKSVKCSKRT